MTLLVVVGNHKERRLLEQHDFVSAARAAELAQVGLQRLHVGQQDVHDVGPSLIGKAAARARTWLRTHIKAGHGAYLVERLVPDGGFEARHVERAGGVENLLTALLEDLLALGLGEQVHLVNQAEDLGTLGELFQSLKAALVVRKVFLCALRSYPSVPGTPC